MGGAAAGGRASSDVGGVADGVAVAVLGAGGVGGVGGVGVGGVGGGRYALTDPRTRLRR